MSQSPLVLYVETNFLMSIATGRDPAARSLIGGPESVILLVLPQVCFMEAFSVLKDMHRQRNQFKNVINQQISETSRDNTSLHSKTLLSMLEGARIANDKLLEDIDNRLYEAVRALGRNAELIGLTGEILEENQTNTLIDDPTDNLILCCILAHARARPAESKVLLTGNRRDFGVPIVQNELGRAGVVKSFWDASQFRQWFTSQPRS